MTVNFTATGNGQDSRPELTYYGIVGSSTDITSVTPVPYHILRSFSLRAGRAALRKGREALGASMRGR